MIKRIVTVFLIMLLSNTAFAFDNGDFQYWISESLTWKAKDNWKAYQNEMFRIGNDVTDVYYEHTEIGAIYSGISKYIDVTMGYRHTFNISKEVWKQELMPNAAVTLKTEYKGIKLSDKNRFEFRMIEDKDDNWRYRNKATIAFPRFTSAEIEPYVAGEIFIDLNEFEFNRNRFYAGMSFKLFKYTRFNVYYLLQTTKSTDDWINYNIVGTEIKFSF